VTPKNADQESQAIDRETRGAMRPSDRRSQWLFWCSTVRGGGAEQLARHMGSVHPNCRQRRKSMFHLESYSWLKIQRISEISRGIKVS
jgi:hypothetical protein